MGKNPAFRLTCFAYQRMRSLIMLEVGTGLVILRYFLKITIPPTDH